MHHRRSTRRALLLVTLAAIAWGTGGATGALLSEYAGLTPTATSFWRLAAAALWLTIAPPPPPSGCPPPPPPPAVQPVLPCALLSDEASSTRSARCRSARCSAAPV